MVTIERIEREFGMPLCRECINGRYGSDLTPKDCVYGYPYPHKCPRCGRTKNIVTGFRPGGRLKLMLK